MANLFYQVPKRKPKLLKESNADSKPLPAPKKFATFSPHDSRSIEASYQNLIEEDEDKGGSRLQSDEKPREPTSAARNKENTSFNDAGNEDGGGRVKVPVNEDFLFDVDIERRELAPVYWLGPIYDIRRGSWFYQEGSVLRPCEENLAAQLEEGYLKVKPFRYPKTIEKASSRPPSMRFGEEAKTLAFLSSRDGIASNEVTPRSSAENLKIANQRAQEEAVNITKSNTSLPAHQPQTHRLFGTYMNSVVTYQDDTVAWLSSDGIMSRMSSTVYQRFAGGGYLGGIKIVRGYVEPGKSTEAKLDRPSTPATATASESFTKPGPQADERQQKILKRRSAPPGTNSLDKSSAVADLETSPNKTETHEAALKRQISSMVADSINSEAGEEAIRRREEKEIQNDYQDHEGEDQSREIEHLILVTHGIGQRLGMR
jgi:hypothetical protein